MNIEARRLKTLIAFVAAAGLVLALCLGPTRPALGLGPGPAAHRPLAGSLDPSFGSGGIVKGGGGIEGIAVQPDGKIVVAAFGSVVRYLPDGSLDSSFGDAGHVATGFDAYTVALQPDGKIVVAGSSGPVSDTIGSEFAVARYEPDGAPDTSFGTNGIAQTVIPETTECGGTSGATAYALAVLPGGDVLAAGSVSVSDCYIPGNSGWALVRYTPDGSPDPTFGDAGIVQTWFFGQDGLGGIAVQADGKIVASGSAGISGHGGIDVATMAVARYEPDGSLDPGFGTGGKATTDTKLYYLGGPPILRRGKILVAGSTSKAGNSWYPVLARWTANGRLDSTFGRLGFAKIGRRTGTPSAMLAQSDGKILIAESSSYRGPSRIVRILPDGRLDPSFGRGGIVTLGGVSTLALQPDRKILVGAHGGASTLARLIGGNNCVVPDLRGEAVSRTNAKLDKSYCRRGRTSRRFSSTVDRGRVISTTPQRGARLPGGAKVDLVLSRGERLRSGAPADRRSASGLVFRYYRGSGWQFQPLLSFEQLNNLVSAGQAPAARRLVEALLARGQRQGAALYWRYDFPYQGGPVPWSSGFVQAVAAQALARAGRLLGRPALLRPAGAALQGLRRGLLLHVGGGLWIREYGFTQQVILNSQLQSLLSLRSYADLVGTPQAARLVQSLYRATVRLLPRFDLGCHSLYQLGGPVADRHYQDYHVALLERLAGQYPEEPLFRRLYLRWRRCA